MVDGVADANKVDLGTVEGAAANRVGAAGQRMLVENFGRREHTII